MLSMFFVFKGHVGISVPDLKAALKRMESLGVKVLENCSEGKSILLSIFTAFSQHRGVRTE